MDKKAGPRLRECIASLRPDTFTQPWTYLFGQLCFRVVTRNPPCMIDVPIRPQVQYAILTKCSLVLFIHFQGFSCCKAATWTTCSAAAAGTLARATATAAAPEPAAVPEARTAPPLRGLYVTLGPPTRGVTIPIYV